MIYPNGQAVYYNYDVNSRVANIATSGSPTGAQTYAAYTYLGLGTIVKVAHPAVSGGLNLTYGSASDSGGAWAACAALFSPGSG